MDTQDLLRWNIPFHRNAFVVNVDRARIEEHGLRKWKSAKEKCRVYFEASKPGIVSCSVNGRFFGLNYLKVQHGYIVGYDEKYCKFKEVLVASEKTSRDIECGTIELRQGFNFLEFSCTEALVDEAGIGDLNWISLYVACNGIESDFIKFNEKGNVRWQRGPPAGHLNHKTIKKNTEWIFTEMVIPRGSDVRGNYYAAVQTNVGYVGIQTLGDGSKRVLFSVWAKTRTDNPDSVPENEKVMVMALGANVTTKKFGNEGTGQQCFYNYEWETDKPYQFLFHQKIVDNTTRVTAWFRADGEWKLLASFLRPEDRVPLLDAITFNECFIPDYGYTKRRCYITNVWARNNEGWYELDSAVTSRTTDGRYDHRSGTENGMRFIECGGFFFDGKAGETITRGVTIDIDALPVQ